MKNIEAQARIGALVTWVNAMDAGRPIGSIRKKLAFRLRLISDALDNPAELLAALEDLVEEFEDLAEDRIPRRRAKRINNGICAYDNARAAIEKATKP